ncbi:hypothetical protein L0222_05165 [bacterium]|nr:hypothetical protein [bacterium]MCI0603275.1 hypothetical protein [bacterium]
MNGISKTNSQPQTGPLQKTDNQPASKTETKPEEKSQTTGAAKPAADPAAQKAEHAMEGQARAAQLDASLNKVDQAKVDENAKQIKEKLSYGVTDLAVTDQDVKDVRDKLESLSPGEYKAQVERMSKDGVLQRYMDNMSDADKKGFLEQGAKKGYLNGGEVKVPDGPLNPPAGPTLYDNKPELPKEMRELISEQNLKGAAEYDKAYGQYMDRYKKELDNCKSPEEMRKLGHWAPKHPLGQEPGYANKAGDALADKWADERITKTRGDKEAREMAMEKMYKFTGRRPAGDVFVEVEANAKVEFVNSSKTGVSVGGKAGATVGTGDGLRTSTTREDGVSQQVGDFKVGGTERSKDGSVAGQAGYKGSQVQVRDDGTFEVKIKQGGGGKTAGYGPYASYNPNQADARFGAHASVNAEIGSDGGPKVKGEVGGKVGVGIRGITGDELYEGLRQGPGYWNDPAELQQGKSWNDLPKETQERYQKHYGWSEKEWQGKLPKYQPDAA